MFRLLITFIFFAGIMYYFNIDLRGMVDRSGVPEWLATHGISTKSQTAQTATSTDVTSTTSTTTPS